MKIKYILVLVLMMISTVLSAKTAQTPKAEQADEDRFFYGSDPDSDMKITPPGNSFSGKGIQYGAMITPVFTYDDNDLGRLGTYIVNAKIWAKTYLWSNSYLYIRGKESYLGKPVTNEGIYSTIKSDNVIDLDLAYLSMSTSSGMLNLTVGRKFYNIGTGLVLNGRGDGGEAVLNYSFLNIDVLGMYTGLLLKDNNPYGLSDRDLADGAERVFAGGTVSASFYNQKLYLFGLAQVDNSKQVKGQETKYDSQYYGGGLEGILFQNLSYYAEYIYETGKSYVNDTVNRETSIAAMAVNSGINYYFPVKLSPMLIFQYTYGSGDSNRSYYTSSNRTSGTGNDTGFIAFGTYSGGYALKAKPGNIHIFKLGASLAPADNLSLGAKYLYYMKDKEDAAINNGTDAYNNASFIGQGVDVSLRYRIFYDLSMYVNYGIFLPGSAYDSSTGEKQFLMAGVNLSI